MICSLLLLDVCMSPCVPFKTKRRESLTLSGLAERAHLCSSGASRLKAIACKAAKLKNECVYIKIYLSITRNTNRELNQRRPYHHCSNFVCSIVNIYN